MRQMLTTLTVIAVTMLAVNLLVSEITVGELRLQHNFLEILVTAFAVATVLRVTHKERAGR